MNSLRSARRGAARWPVSVFLCLATAVGPLAADAEPDAGAPAPDSVPVGTFLGVVGPADGAGTPQDAVPAKVEAAERELTATFAAPPLVFESPAALAQRTGRDDVRRSVLETTDEQWPARIRASAALWKYAFVLTVRYARAETGEWFYTASLFQKDGTLVREITQPSVTAVLPRLASLVETTPVSASIACGQAQVICDSPVQATVGTVVNVHCRVEPPGAIQLELRTKTPGADDFAVSPLAPNQDGSLQYGLIPTKAGDFSYLVLGSAAGAAPDTSAEVCRLTSQPIPIAPLPAPPESAEMPADAGTPAAPLLTPLTPPVTQPPPQTGALWPAQWNKTQCPENHQSCASARIEPFTPGEYCLDDTDEQAVQIDVRRIYNDIRSAVGIFDKDGNLTGVKKAALVVTGYASLGEHEKTSEALERYACHQLPPESGLQPIDNVYLLDPDLDNRLAFFRGESLYMSLLLLSVLDKPSPFRNWFPHVLSTNFVSSKGGRRDAEREPDPVAGHAEVTGKVISLHSDENIRSTAEVILFDEPAPGESSPVVQGKGKTPVPAGSSGSGINVLNVKVSVDSPPPLPPEPVIAPVLPAVPSSRWLQWIGGSVGLSGLAMIITGSVISANATIANNNSLYETGTNNGPALSRAYAGYGVLGTGLVLSFVGSVLVVTDILERQSGSGSRH